MARRFHDIAPRPGWGEIAAETSTFVQHATLPTPPAALLGQFAVGKLERLVGVEWLAGFACSPAPRLHPPT